MFNTGDKVKKITDGKIGTIKDSVLTSNGTKYHVQFENGAEKCLSRYRTRWPSLRWKRPF